MSRDLSFWKTSKKAKSDDKTIYEALSCEEYLEFIDDIPVSDIQQDFNKVFRDWENHNNKFYEKGSESFELMLTKQFARVDCYGMTENSMNKIIDILNEYNCPLYDSAIDVRFD